MIEEKVKDVEEKAKKRIWINPCDCDCGCDEGEEDVYHLTYELPGVDKKDIDLKITKEALRLVAARGDVEYVNEFNFVCDVDAEAVQASYNNGLLLIEVPLDCPNPFNDAKKVSIS
jgi:HSP20 family molecular chaperone IbpA